MSKRTPEQIIAGARRPETTVKVCLRADLSDAIATLEAQLVEIAQENLADGRLGSGPSTEERRLADEIHALELEADENSLDLVVRALPRSDWRAAKARHPANEADSELGWAVDRDELASDVLAASVVKPEVAPAALLEMADLMSEGQWGKIRDAILTVNGGDGSVPFSQRASLIRRLSSSEDELHEPTASQSDSSTAGSPAQSPKSRRGSGDSRLGG